MIRFLSLVAILISSTVFAQEPKQKVYPTGHKTPANIEAMVAKSWSLHGKRLKALPQASAAAYDCTTLGIVPPIVDQGQCGSCWDFSGCGIVTSALIKGGYGKNDGTLRMCEQFVLDCGQNGGCDGDDNTTVLAMAKATGLPNASDYGPYNARAANCKAISSLKLFKIADWGFCGSQSSVATTQSIKDAMVQYGPIGAAIAADNAFMNSPAGVVFKGSGSRDINHDIILVGWDDAKGAWKLRNSWGTSWCDSGYQWIAYGANQVGTEAVWCTATALPPDPTPTPPVPPTPGPTPVPLPTASTITLDGPLNAGSYQIVPTGSITINSMMTLKDFADALEKASRGGVPQAAPKATPCPLEQRIDRMERIIERLDAVLTGGKK